MGWQHIRQFYELENCGHLQLVYNRQDPHDILAIVRQKLAMCRNRPKLNCTENSLVATFLLAFAFSPIDFFFYLF